MSTLVRTIVKIMITVNALKIRNQFGEVLKTLEDSGEPIYVSKGREVKAVLISIEDFNTRFVDKRADEEARKIYEDILERRRNRTTSVDATSVLRQLRGYKD